MKFSKICLGLLLISSFNVLLATRQSTGQKLRFSKFSGKVHRNIRVTFGRKIDINAQRKLGSDSFGKMVNESKNDQRNYINIIFFGHWGDTGGSSKAPVSFATNLIFKYQDSFYVKIICAKNTGKIRYKGIEYCRETRSGRSGEDLPLPQEINNVLQNNDSVAIEWKFYNNDSGAYKLSMGLQNETYGSFDILLADDQPEPSTPQPPSETPAPTEKPTTDQREGQNVQKQFQNIMNEIAGLKKMINQLMDKMQK